MAEISSQIPFRVGEWVVDPDSGRLHRDDQEVKLEPKVMQVLVYLAQHQGKVVSRESLEATAWAGTVVGYDAVTCGIIKLRKALGDDTRHPRYIETISKKGYRLIASVSTADTTTTAASLDFTKQVDQATNNAPKRWLVAVAIIAISVVGYTMIQWPGTRSSVQNVENPDGITPSARTDEEVPSVVVLPFKNLSNESEQEYFSDGVTDDIITALSKVGALRVIARQSSYHYKNTNVNFDIVARELGIDFIVHGSVQKLGKQIRVNVQLSHVGKGYTIWAERFDGDIRTIFDIQDKITKNVINAMYVTLSSQENKHVTYRSTSNFEAYDVFLLGQQSSRQRTREGNALAIDYYRQAIDLDPGYARAYGALAVALTDGYRHGWTNLSFEEARERAIAFARKAVALDQSTPQVYWSLGFVYLFRKEFKEAEQAARQSVALSPNYADGYGLLAFIANWQGKAEDAERYIKKAIGLNPYHTFDYPWNLGLSYYTMGRYTEAVEALQEALERNETALYPRLYLAASYVQLGQQEDAEWEIEQANIVSSGTTIPHLENTLPYETDALMDKLLTDLRKAGVAEK